MTDNAPAALKAAYEAAPKVYDTVLEGPYYHVTLIGENGRDLGTLLWHGGSGQKLGDFLVAAHTHVPALLAEVEKLRAAIKEAMEADGEGHMYSVLWAAVNDNTGAP